MNDLEKKVRGILILCVILVGIYLAGKCYSMWEQKSGGQGGRILGKAYAQAGACAAELFLPGMDYGQEELPDDVFSAVLQTVREQFPILSFQETDCGEEAIIEDSETAEAIREENEKLIAQKSQEENQRRRSQRRISRRRKGRVQTRKYRARIRKVRAAGRWTEQ